MFEDTSIQPAEAEHSPAGQGQVSTLSVAQARALLKKVNLRASRQRIALARILFAGEHRHVVPAELHRQARLAGIRVSLATIYDALKEFADCRLMRRVAVCGGIICFDTHVGHHHHFYIEAEKRVIDMPENALRIRRLPEPPAGYVITGINAVIHLKRIGAAGRHDLSGCGCQPGARNAAPLVRALTDGMLAGDRTV